MIVHRGEGDENSYPVVAVIVNERTGERVGRVEFEAAQSWGQRRFIEELVAQARGARRREEHAAERVPIELTVPLTGERGVETAEAFGLGRVQ